MRKFILRHPWRDGPLPADAGPVLVSATRFHYRHRRDLPIVARHAWALRRGWGERPGAIGLFTGGELLAPVTYSLSVWASEDDLRTFLRSPEHVRLVRRFKPRLVSATSVTWQAARLDRDAAWAEGLRRLRATPVAA